MTPETGRIDLVGRHPETRNIRFDTFTSGNGDGVLRAMWVDSGVSVTVAFGQRRDDFVRTADDAKREALRFLSAPRPEPSADGSGGGATSRTDAHPGSPNTGAASE